MMHFNRLLSGLVAQIGQERSSTCYRLAWLVFTLITVPLPGSALAADYLVIDLNGDTGRFAMPSDINDLGNVVGSYYPDGPAFIYNHERVIGLPGLQQYEGRSNAISINNHNVIVGVDRKSGAFVSTPFVYTDGPRYLDASAPDRPLRINDFGQILWNGYLDSTPLPLLPGSARTDGYGLNNLGQVVGAARMSGAEHAVLIHGATIMDLGTLGGTRSRATDINDLGQVIGFSERVDRSTRGFLYADGAMNDIGALQLNGVEASQTYANGINNLGQIVGQSVWGSSINEVQHAFVYKDGQIIDLNGLIDPALNITLTNAVGINNREQIIAVSVTPAGWHGYLLNPAPGTNQFFPILPTALSGEEFIFQGGTTGSWYDPPAVSGFAFEMSGSSLFTGILDFPRGFDSKFAVAAEGMDLGEYGPGEPVDFVALLGHGVSSFIISGIAPTVDIENPQGFPIKLAFDTHTADFSMIGLVPEPSTLVLASLGSIVALASALRGCRTASRRMRPKRLALLEAISNRKWI